MSIQQQKKATPTKKTKKEYTSIQIEEPVGAFPYYPLRYDKNIIQSKAPSTIVSGATTTVSSVTSSIGQLSDLDEATRREEWTEMHWLLATHSKENRKVLVEKCAYFHDD